MPVHARTFSVHVLLLAALAVACTACEKLPVIGGKASDPQRTRELAAMVYPKDAPFAEDLDLIVTQEGNKLVLENRTPRNYENATLWVNQQYVSPVERIAIGVNKPLPLSRFISRHSQPFPTAGPLKPDKRGLVVQAELVTPATAADGTAAISRHRLLVRVGRKLDIY